MQPRIFSLLSFTLLLMVFIIAAASQPTLDETPRSPGEWGFRPEAGGAIQVTPPNFSWRPQSDALTYELQCSRLQDFSHVDYSEEGVSYNVHTPARTFEPGEWHWRFRFVNQNGDASEWSSVRSFTIAEYAREFPLPERGELRTRIPDAHPRLFIRPEWLPDLRERKQSDLQAHYDQLVAECEALLADPPPTDEPPLYPPGVERLSEEWREIWWGNRIYTINALDNAAKLAFTWLLDGNEAYAELARRILMDCAEWNPTGSTGYRYNDEAGMPYNYYFSRTYSFLYDYLNEDERAKCREVMTVRGREMYDHLRPSHLWRPYGSHQNRAWHFLGEIGIAFLDEIPDAEEWVWFAVNVFFNAYPVWSDEDGGWHEGMNYWRSYIARFTWWADIMLAAMDLNAFDKPYFSQAGYYALYLQPPGTLHAGFGDLNANRPSRLNVDLMSVLAAQARNPYWQWYVEAHDREPSSSGYVGFVRGALPTVEAKPPSNLPGSRLFRGTGQAMLNTNLMDAHENIQVIFKSSPFGTHSHGYEANNSFLLYTFGERLLIRSGQRDIYGSDHHRDWMWHTKSVNSITINGGTQRKRTPHAVGEILGFYTSPRYDYVAGEAGQAYEEPLKRFTRHLLFIKPEAVVIYDVLEAHEPSSYEWRLHAVNKMEIRDSNEIHAENGPGACRVHFLWPESLEISQTDQFDPPPRPRVQLTQYHLTATPPERSAMQEFVTVLLPHRAEETLDRRVEREAIANGHAVRIQLDDGEALVLLQANAGERIQAHGQTSEAEVSVFFFDPAGELRESWTNEKAE